MYPGRPLRFSFALCVLASAMVFSACPEPEVAVSISPENATVLTGGSRQFTATVTAADDTSVTWSVQEGEAGGTITADGTYTAPATAGTFHVVATSVADSTRSATATVTVNLPPAVEITVEPATVRLAMGEVIGFEATVVNATNEAVTWTVGEGDAGGTITSAGVYTAPRTGGTFTIVATSVEDPSRSGTAQVQVDPELVTGWRLTVFVDGAAIPDALAWDLTATDMFALIPDGSGGYTELPVEGTDYGLFQIEGVSTASYLLRTEESVYVELSDRFIDLSKERMGRMLSEYPSQDTYVDLGLTGLAPWEQGDDLYITSPQAGLGNAVIDEWLDEEGEPAELGGTTTSGLLDYFLVRWKLDYGSVIEAGDQVVVHHMEAQADRQDVAFAGATTRGMTTTDYAMADGETSTLAGALSALTLKPFTATYNRGAFETLRDQVNPAATPSGHGVYVQAAYTPDGEPRAFASWPDLLWVDLESGTTDASIDYSYGNPFDAAWQETAKVTSTFTREYLAQGATVSYPVKLSVSRTALASELSGKELAPVLTPVRDVKIDGKDAFVASTMGFTPTVTWSAPGVGTPNRYVVTFNEVFVFATDATAHVEILRIHTFDNSVTVPPGELYAGREYFVTVRAYDDQVTEKQPLLAAPEPSAHADTASAIFTTPE